MANTIGTAYVQIEPSFSGVVSKIDKEMGGAGSSGGKSFTAGFGKAVGTTGALVAGAVAAGTAAVGAFAKSSVEAGAAFDTSMAQVAATMGTTVDQIGDLRDFAQQMGSTTAFSATEAADALNYMALAGYDAETSMKMLPNVLNLAAAGDIQLARASDMVTDAQSALGLSLDETTIMVDQMAKASSKSNTSVEQLGDAMLTIGATARGVKGGTQELATVLGVLADNGIKGSEGGTHLRNAILSLQTPTDKGAAALEKLGMTYEDMYDSAGNLRSLPEIFQQMDKAMEGMTQQSKDAIISGVFNKTDLASVNALLGTSTERWDELSKAIGDSTGAAQAMAETQLDNLNGDITLFKSALEGAQIAVADQLTPSLREFVQFGSEGLSKLTSAFKEGGVSGAMNTFGELLSDGISMVIDKLPTIVDAGVQLVEAFGEGLVDNADLILGALEEIFMKIVFLIIDNIPQIINTIVQVITMISQRLSTIIPILIPAVVNGIILLAQALIQNLPLLLQAVIQIMQALADGMIAALPILMDALPGIIVDLVMFIVENGPQFVATVFEIVHQMAAAILDAGGSLLATASTFFSGLVANVKAWLAQLPENMAYFAGQMVGRFITFISQLPGKLQAIWNSLIDKLKDFGTKFVNYAKTIPERFKEFFTVTLKQLPARMLEIGKDIVDGLLNGIKNAWSNLTGAVGDLVNSFLAGVKDQLKIGSPSKVFADEIGKWIPAGIAEGIEDGMGALDTAMDDMTVDLVSRAQVEDISNRNTSVAYSATDSQSDNAVATILASYLPAILQAAENGKVVLSPDAKGIFKIVRDQNRIMIDTTGYHALA